jgi:hypothetical protein
MMFSQPEPVISPCFGVLSEIKTITKCQSRVGAFSDWAKIENGIEDHG